MPFKISLIGGLGVRVLSGTVDTKMNCLFNKLAISLGSQIFVPYGRSFVKECLLGLLDDMHLQIPWG